MALLFVSTELVLSKAGNSTLTTSVFHRLTEDLYLCTCDSHVTRHSSQYTSCAEIWRLHKHRNWAQCLFCFSTIAHQVKVIGC